MSSTFINLILSVWGRNGFDGDIETGVACRACCQLVNTADLNIIADDYKYALAA